MCVSIGFSKLITSGYDEDSDLYYIVMHKYDQDLNEIIKEIPFERLTL
jgi:hypothetical protein